MVNVTRGHFVIAQIIPSSSHASWRARILPVPRLASTIADAPFYADKHTVYTPLFATRAEALDAAVKAL